MHHVVQHSLLVHLCIMNFVACCYCCMPCFACQQCVQLQVDAMGQENGLLRRILLAHAKEMTEAENVSDKICTLAGDLLHLLTEGQLADKQPDLDASQGCYH